MNVGEKIRHRRRPDLGIGELVEIDAAGLCKAVFERGVVFSGVALDNFISVDEELRQQKIERTEETHFIAQFATAYRDHSLAQLDRLFRDVGGRFRFSVESFTQLKMRKVRQLFGADPPRLDSEQEHAIARPELRVLVRARAGSGKTRTLAARAVLAIRDEKLHADQVLTLAFNKAAAKEIGARIRELGRLNEYSNARTFHSLAYQLAKPSRKLLFDAGGHPSQREQARFVQRMMHRILNPAFKESIVEFFRREIEQVEELGRDLSPAEYLSFRRALQFVSLNGDRVKSNGEKFVADFLFEHGIEYRYERTWKWQTDFLDGAAYKPDFSLVVNGEDIILEHWAIDPSDKAEQLPSHWNISAEQYRSQIEKKRRFWSAKGIRLLETHAGAARAGRASFEDQLRTTLQRNGIATKPLPREEIIQKVFANEVSISRLAELFLQFIQRAKKRGWSAAEAARHESESPASEPRVRLFHQLALRAYSEYEAMLDEEQAMDFDDLLVQAAAEVSSRGGSVRIHLGEGRMMPISELRWILLDEYQDFTALYFRMLSAILRVNSDVRLMAVGDDWQAINAFAGAELSYFERFDEFFAGGASTGITTNYRSDSAIVTVANRLMCGRGDPAMASKPSGLARVRDIDEIWIEFRADEEFRAAREQDGLYFTAPLEGRRLSARALMQAQALKACAEIIMRDPARDTLLLARTKFAYGTELEEFRVRLVRIVSRLGSVDAQQANNSIAAMTVHAAKGQEAHRVIILEATRSQFPKIHPDNLLFGLFDVTPQAVLAEERRLFYVALTRAEVELHILADSREPSPFLKEIENAPQTTPPGLKHDAAPLVGLARRIEEVLEGI